MNEFPKLIEYKCIYGSYKVYQISDFKIGGHDFIATGFEVPQYGWTCRTCNTTITNYDFITDGLRNGKLNETSQYLHDYFPSCQKVVTKKNHNWQIIEDYKDLINIQIYRCNKCLYYKKTSDKNVIYSSDGMDWPKQWDFAHDIWRDFILLTCEEVNIKRALE